MHAFRKLFDLPKSLLLLIAVSPSAKWAEGSFPNFQDRPAERHDGRGDDGGQKRWNAQIPVAVRKMSADEGEKFFWEYWQFDDWDRKFSPDQGHIAEEEIVVNGNGSFLQPPSRPLIALDQRSSRYTFRNLFRRHHLLRRDFQCPSGTSSCSGIDRPDSCCNTGDVCVLVRDSGLGDVGCCPRGSSCSGGVSSCDTEAGYSSCPGSPNGGCCIPNYECLDVGCVFTNTVIVEAPEPSITTVTQPPSSSTTSRTSLVCGSGSRSCAASLGGGCCPGDQICGPETCLPTSTSTSRRPTSSADDTAAPPVRPTSGSEVTVAAAPSETGLSACPTGFYRCEAFYEGGCCRVGRDCDSTSCPALATTEVVVENGVTIVGGAIVRTVTGTGSEVVAQATESAQDDRPGGSCASGWYSCAPDTGGGCCPSGYSCGASCTLPADGDTVGKIAPSAAPSVEVIGWTAIMIGAAFGVAMLLL